MFNLKRKKMKFKKEDWNIAVQRAYDKFKEAKERYNKDYKYANRDIEYEDEERLQSHIVPDFILNELKEIVDRNKFNDFHVMGGSSDCGPSGNQYNYNIVCATIGDDGKPYLCYSIDLEFADWDDVDEIYESLIID